MASKKYFKNSLPFIWLLNSNGLYLLNKRKKMTKSQINTVQKIGERICEGYIYADVLKQSPLIYVTSKTITFEWRMDGDYEVGDEFLSGKQVFNLCKHEIEELIHNPSAVIIGKLESNFIKA